MMGVLDSIANFFTGGLAEKVVDTVKEYFPPSMSEMEKAEFELKLKDVLHKQEIELFKLQNEAEKNLNERIRDYEGTVTDLRSIPLIGTLLIFLRGAFRPLFAYALAYIDFQVFSQSWQIQDEQIKSAFWVINFVVIGFYFGERAIRNVLPLAKEFFKKQ